MDESSFESCCRLCLADHGTLIEIFHLQNDTTIVEMIKEICIVEIEEDDALPKEVCAECLDVITAAFNLRVKSQNNDRLLRGEPEDECLKEELIEYEPEDSNYEVVEIGYMVESQEPSEVPNYSCDKCPEIKPTKEEIQQHIVEHHMHVCNICEKQCKTQFSLRNHISRMHNDDRIAVFSCEYCKTSFKMAKKLEKHKKIHNYFDEIIDEDSKVIYKCRVEGCTKSFDSMSDKLYTHINVHEKGEKSKEEPESLVCPHCGNCYKSKQVLQQHIKRHFEGGDRYQCQNCPQKFKSWGELYYHKAVHMTERPYVCDLCNKGFKAKRDLRNHKKRHEEKDIKNFQCSYCHLMLKSRYTLTRHMLIHTGEKPHECSYCHKRFTQKNELNKHLRIHIGENTYKCEHPGCPKSFRLLAELRIHQEDHYVQKDDYC